MDLPNLPPELAVEDEPFPIDDLDSALADAAGIFRVGPEQLLRDDSLDAETVPVLYRAPVRWRVEDDRSAEWAARHWHEAVDAIDEVARTADFWIGQIKGWAEGRTSVLDNRRRFMAAQLEMYALEQRDVSGGKRKTVVLPSATVRTSSAAERIKVIPDKAQEFVAWAARHAPALVRVKEEPKVGEFGQHLRISRVLDYVAFHARLSCGHEIDTRLTPDPDQEWEDAVLMEHTCGECLVDPIDGAPTRLVEMFEANPIWRPVVLATIEDPEWLPSSPGEENPHGTAAGPALIEVEVPGVTVEAESVTAKVGR